MSFLRIGAVGKSRSPLVPHLSVSPSLLVPCPRDNDEAALLLAADGVKQSDKASCLSPPPQISGGRALLHRQPECKPFKQACRKYWGNYEAQGGGLQLSAALRMDSEIHSAD